MTWIETSRTNYVSGKDVSGRRHPVKSFTNVFFLYIVICFLLLATSLSVYFSSFPGFYFILEKHTLMHFEAHLTFAYIAYTWKKKQFPAMLEV